MLSGAAFNVLGRIFLLSNKVLDDDHLVILCFAGTSIRLLRVIITSRLKDRISLSGHIP